MSWKEWDQGEVVEAGDFQTYIQNQVVQRYANASERTTVLGTAVEEGMVSYREDANVVEVYDGSSWVDFTGDITQITAGTALTGGGTAGDVTLNVDETELFTGGTAGYTALSNGTAGLSYQPVSHNYIINGAFDIWQRGTSFAGASVETYFADRFAFDRINGGTVTRESFTPADIEAIGFGDAKYFARVSGIGDVPQQVAFLQRVEDVRTLASQQVTISFWAKSSTAKDYRVNLRQNFGSGGSSSVKVDDNVSVTTSWQRFSVTKTLGSMSGKTIGSGSSLEVDIRRIEADNFTLDLWGVQLEAGSIATPFKRNAPSLQGELAACQRYYQRFEATSSQDRMVLGNGMCTATNEADILINHKVEMRAIPTASFGDIADFGIAGSNGGPQTATAFTLLGQHQSTFATQIRVDTSGGLVEGNATYMRGLDVADAYFELSAEL